MYQNIDRLESKIETVLRNHAEYPGIWRNWLENGLFWIERLQDQLKEELTDEAETALRNYVDESMSIATDLYERWSPNSDYADALDRLEPERARLIVDYIRVANSDNYSV